MFLQIENLTKTYQRHDGAIHAVDDLSLEIAKGSFVTITGASGSGKTTLLLMLGGLLRPTAGKMHYEGKAVDLYSEREMASFRSDHVGFVMQSFALIPYLTAIQNVMIALNVKHANKVDNYQRALELLQWVGVDDRKNHFPKELSAGQQQRVAIARALANNPDVLLADEPTGNLDPLLAEDIMSILKEISENHDTTIIMVTHSPMAAEFGNVRIQVKNGKIHSPSLHETMVINN